MEQTVDGELDGDEPGQPEADDEPGSPGGPVRQSDGEEREAQEGEGERADAEREAGAEDAEPAPTTLEAPEGGEQRSNAEAVRIRSREHRSAHADREDSRGPAGDLPHSSSTTDAKSCRGGDRDDRQGDAAHERSRQVREQTVGGERVVARVPEVVPDENAVTREQVAVQVCGSISGRGAENHQRDRNERGDRAGADDLALGEAVERARVVPTEISTTVPAKPDMRARVGSLSKAAVLVATALALLAGEARAETQAFRVLVVPGLELADLEALQQRAAVGLLVPGAGPRVSEEAALAGLERGTVGTPFGAGFPSDRC